MKLFWLQAGVFCSAFLYDEYICCKLGYEKRVRELCEEEFEEICKASIQSFTYLQSQFSNDLSFDNIKQGVSVATFCDFVASL